MAALDHPLAAVPRRQLCLPKSSNCCEKQLWLGQAFCVFLVQSILVALPALQWAFGGACLVQVKSLPTNQDVVYSCGSLHYMYNTLICRVLSLQLPCDQWPVVGAEPLEKKTTVN